MKRPEQASHRIAHSTSPSVSGGGVKVAFPQRCLCAGQSCRGGEGDQLDLDAREHDDATGQLLMLCTTEPHLLAPRAALVCSNTAYDTFFEREIVHFQVESETSKSRRESKEREAGEGSSERAAMSGAVEVWYVSEMRTRLDEPRADLLESYFAA